LAEQTSDRKSFFKRIQSGKEGSTKEEMTFFDHIEELRWHILRSLLVWASAAISIFVFRGFIFDDVILAPTKSNFVSYQALCSFGKWLHLGDSFCMPPVVIDFQYNTVTGPFSSALSIAMIGGLIVAFPFIFWELWRFIKPALSPKEIKYARGSIFWVSLCFFSGAAFAYYLLAPFTFNFLATFTIGTSQSIKYMPSINDYVETLTNLTLGCALAFQLPILAFVLAKIGLITGSLLRKYFKFAFVIILVVAAIITPSPDWTSQFLVAIPLLILYWISIILASRVEKQRAKAEKEWS
jgi:sec-independent protein translocase protein TatC